MVPCLKCKGTNRSGENTCKECSSGITRSTRGSIVKARKSVRVVEGKVSKSEVVKGGGKIEEESQLRRSARHNTVDGREGEETSGVEEVEGEKKGAEEADVNLSQKVEQPSTEEVEEKKRGGRRVVVEVPITEGKEKEEKPSAGEVEEKKRGGRREVAKAPIMGEVEEKRRGGRREVVKPPTPQEKEKEGPITEGVEEKKRGGRREVAKAPIMGEVEEKRRGGRREVVKPPTPQEKEKEGPITEGVEEKKRGERRVVAKAPIMGEVEEKRRGGRREVVKAPTPQEKEKGEPIMGEVEEKKRGGRRAVAKAPITQEKEKEEEPVTVEVQEKKRGGRREVVKAPTPQEKEKGEPIMGEVEEKKRGGRRAVAKVPTTQEKEKEEKPKSVGVGDKRRGRRGNSAEPPQPKRTRQAHKEEEKPNQGNLVEKKRGRGCDSVDAPLAKKSKKEEEKLYCICRKPVIGKAFMIECSGCKDWFHGSCVHVTPREAEHIGDGDYFCPGCKVKREAELKELEKKKKKQKKVALYCICRTPFSRKHFYIECETCGEWYHGKCVDMTLKKYKETNSYTCAKCVRKSKRKKKEEVFCICRQPWDDKKLYLECDHCRDRFHLKCLRLSPNDANKIDLYFCRSCERSTGKKSVMHPVISKLRPFLLNPIEALPGQLHAALSKANRIGVLASSEAPPLSAEVTQAILHTYRIVQKFHEPIPPIGTSKYAITGHVTASSFMAVLRVLLHSYRKKDGLVPLVEQVKELCRSIVEESAEAAREEEVDKENNLPLSAAVLEKTAIESMGVGSEGSHLKGDGILAASDILNQEMEGGANVDGNGAFEKPEAETSILTGASTKDIDEEIRNVFECSSSEAKVDDSTNTSIKEMNSVKVGGELKEDALSDSIEVDSSEVATSVNKPENLERDAVEEVLTGGGSGEEMCVDESEGEEETVLVTDVEEQVGTKDDDEANLRYHLSMSNPTDPYSLSCNSVFLDVGSGMGRPTLVSGCLGIRAGLGIEVQPLAAGVSQLALKRCSVEEVLHSRVFIAEGDILKVPSLEGITHVYSFNVGMPIDVIAQMVALSAWTDSVKVVMLYEPPGKMVSLLQMGFLGDCPRVDNDDDYELPTLSLSMRMPGAHSYRCFIVPFTASRKEFIKLRLKPPAPVEKDEVDSFMTNASTIAINNQDKAYEDYIESIGHNSILQKYFANQQERREMERVSIKTA